jgi:para-aminobenzoate synthetase/4-amino-4-deoxychorismate lyase
VERRGVLLTPPLASGALPGVLREQLLAAGQAVEAVLLPDDLAQGFLLGNALRGLIPVRFE